MSTTKRLRKLFARIWVFWSRERDDSLRHAGGTAENERKWLQAKARARFWTELRAGEQEAAAISQHVAAGKRQGGRAMWDQTRNTCDNINHRRTIAPIGHCPECGIVVNAHHHASGCSESEHNASRRTQTVFCVTCGAQLIFDT